MLPISRRAWLGGVLAVALAGCAPLAVRPPTPAADLRVDPSDPPPGEHFYVLVFASQRVPKSPHYSHSFATVVHTIDQEPGVQKPLDYHTISWMPRTLDIHVMRLHPEPGVNLTLEESLRFAQDTEQRVSLWGPYEIRPNFYKRFLMQKEFLETNVIGYQGLDNLGEAARKGNGCDCIHAITDTDPELGRANYPLIWYGDAASEHAVYRLLDRGTLHRPVVEHDELLGLLGLSEFPLVRRRLGDRLFDFPRLQPAKFLAGWGGR